MPQGCVGRERRIARYHYLTRLLATIQTGIPLAFPQRRSIMLRVFGFVLMLCVCVSAPAATIQQLSLDQMTLDATAIVRARVTGSSVSFTGATIYTHYKLQVSEVWNGSGAAEVMLPGGVAGGYRQTYPGVPALKTGTEY